MLHPPRSPIPLRIALGLWALVCLGSQAEAVAGDLSGIVLDPDRRPVPQARVLLTQQSVRASTTTDRRGRFRFAGLAPGRYELQVALPGFQADPLVVDVTPTSAPEVEVQLRLSALSESVVVTAAQVDRPRSKTPDSVTVLDGAQLARWQIETVADALRLVPGLTVTQSGGRGGVTSLFPRGGESNFTLVMIDGVRMNTFGGGFDFAHLPTAEIAQIEVVRGPQSALYGSDAIGAVVHVITRHGGRPRAAASIETGGFGTHRVTATTSGAAGRWEWGASAEGLDSDGFTGASAGTGERVSNDDYRRRDVSVSGGWRPDRERFVRANLRLGESERGFPGPFGRDPANTFDRIDRVSRGVETTKAMSVGGAFPVVSGWHQRFHAALTTLDGRFASPFGESESGTRRLSVRTQADARLSPRFDLSVGVEALRERATSTFITGTAATPVPVRRTIVGVFGEARLEPASRWLVTAGIRVERITRNALQADPLAFSPRPAFDDATLVAASPKLAVAYTLRPPATAWLARTRLHASIGTGIRPPDAFEIAFTDNPSLEPERSRTLDVGVEQALLGGRLAVDATAFFNRYRDLIVAVGPALENASRFRTDNVANARARGLEVALTASPGGGLTATTTYTWLHSAVLGVDSVADAAPAPFQVGDPLLRRPRHQGAISLAYAHEGLSGFFQLGARGRSLDVEPTLGAFGGLFEVPGYAVVRAGARLRAWRTLEFFGRVDNLLDRSYEETLGFPALGRRVVVGIDVASSR